MVRGVIKALIFAVMICYVFFGDWFGVLPGIVLFGFCFMQEWRDYRHNKKKRLQRQFQDALQKMLSLFQAGYPLEAVFGEAGQHVGSIWGTKAELARGFSQIEAQIRLNKSAETALIQYGETCGLEEIIEFASLVQYVRRGSGDVCSVLADCTSQLAQNYRTEFEIEAIIAAKRYEYQIMKLMPVFILLFIRLTSYSFLEVLYESLWGHLFMTGCLGVYMTAWVIGEHVLKIEV